MGAVATSPAATPPSKPSSDSWRASDPPVTDRTTTNATTTTSATRTTITLRRGLVTRTPGSAEGRPQGNGCATGRRPVGRSGERVGSAERGRHVLGDVGQVAVALRGVEAVAHHEH